MKLLLSVLSLCFALTAMGQPPILEGKTAGISILPSPDSSPRVIYQTPESKESQPAYFLEGELIKPHQLMTIDPNKIASLDVLKGELVVDDETYVGKVSISMLEGYEPTWITLKDLVAKYVKEEDRATLFTIDDQPVFEAADQFWVDEEYVLAIKVALMDQDGVQVRLIQLLTKKEENRKSLYPIRLKG